MILVPLQPLVLNVKLVMKMTKKEDVLLVLLVNSLQKLAMHVTTALEDNGLLKLLLLVKVRHQFVKIQFSPSN